MGKCVGGGGGWGTGGGGGISGVFLYILPPQVEGRKEWKSIVCDRAVTVREMLDNGTLCAAADHTHTLYLPLEPAVVNYLYHWHRAAFVSPTASTSEVSKSVFYAHSTSAVIYIRAAIQAKTSRQNLQAKFSRQHLQAEISRQHLQAETSRQHV